jgi:hypothetical protein
MFILILHDSDTHTYNIEIVCIDLVCRLLLT